EVFVRITGEIIVHRVEIQPLGVEIKAAGITDGARWVGAQHAARRRECRDRRKSQKNGQQQPQRNSASTWRVALGAPRVAERSFSKVVPLRVAEPMARNDWGP